MQLALQRSARLYPAATEPVQDVRLDVTQVVTDLGATGKYAGLSFGGQVPGPTLRVRAGARIRLTVTNRTDEPRAGLAVAGAAQGIAINGTVSDRDDDRRTIAPGQTMEVEMTAMAPGV
ncbi:MAG TPA: multicopper oxidase domain-containing protein, partial [Polyangia bacterium]